MFKIPEEKTIKINENSAFVEAANNIIITDSHKIANIPPEVPASEPIVPPILDNSNRADKSFMDHFPFLDEQGRSPQGSQLYSQVFSPFAGTTRQNIIGSPEAGLMQIPRFSLATTPAAAANPPQFAFSSRSPLYIPPGTFGSYMDMYTGNVPTPCSNVNGMKYNLATSPLFKTDLPALASPNFQNFSGSFNQMEPITNDNFQNKVEDQQK